MLTVLEPAPTPLGRDLADLVQASYALGQLRRDHQLDSQVPE